MDYGVIDARVSTELQEKGYSLDGQVKAGLAYAEKHDIFVPGEYIFQESHTGTDIDRPVIQRIREIVAKDKRVKYVIVYSLDRLARTALGLLLLEKEFRKAGVKVVYIKYEFDDTPEGQLQKQIYAAFSEFERATITHRFTKGKRDKVAGGQYLGGHNAPYGYYNDVHITGNGNDRRTTKTNFLKVNPQESITVRDIYEWLVYGCEESGHIPLTATGVARKLTETKIPSPYAVRCPKYKKRKTPLYQWSPQEVLNLVRNETYCTGIWFYNKSQKRNGTQVPMPKEEWIPVRVPSIIEPELWRAAVRQLDANKRRTAAWPRHPYLLSTRLTCAECGKVMYGTSNRFHEHFYFCSGHYLRAHAFKREDCCTSRRINASTLDNLIWDWLHDLFSDPQRVLNGLKERQSEQREQHSLTIGRLEIINEELSRINGEMKGLMAGFAKQGFDPDSPAFRIFSQQLKDYDARAKAMEEERRKIEAKLNKVVISDDAMDRAKRALQNVETVFKEADTTRRLAFVNMLDVQVVVKAERGTNDIFVEANCCITSSGVMHLEQVSQRRARKEQISGTECSESSISYVRT